MSASTLKSLLLSALDELTALHPETGTITPSTGRWEHGDRLFSPPDELGRVKLKAVETEIVPKYGESIKINPVGRDPGGEIKIPRLFYIKEAFAEATGIAKTLIQLNCAAAGLRQNRATNYDVTQESTFWGGPKYTVVEGTQMEGVLSAHESETVATFSAKIAARAEWLKRQTSGLSGFYWLRYNETQGL